MLTLTGDNTQAGGTSINQGILSVPADAALGAVPALQFNGGTLQPSAPLNTSLPVTVAAGGGTVDTTYGNTAFSGPISGGSAAALTKVGPGTLSLIGNSAFTGPTNVNAGNLVANTSGLIGPVVLSNNTNVTFNQAVNGTYSGVISGQGSFSKQGVGMLTVSATHSYNGATLIGGGVLKLQGVAKGTGMQSYNFDNNTLQGWTNVGQGTTNQFISRSGGDPGGGQTQPNFIGIDNWDNRDGSPSTLWAQSPAFYLNSEGDLTFYLCGGGGTGNQPSNANQVPLGEGANGGGFMGAALEDMSNGNFVWITNGNGGGGWQQNTIPAATLAGLNQGDKYTLNLIDYYSGGWGWTGIDSVSVPGSITSNAPANNLLPFSTKMTIAANAAFDINGGTQTIAGLSGPAGGKIGNSSATPALLYFDAGNGDTTFGGTIQDNNPTGGTGGKISLNIPSGRLTLYRPEHLLGFHRDHRRRHAPRRGRQCPLAQFRRHGQRRRDAGCLGLQPDGPVAHHELGFHAESQHRLDPDRHQFQLRGRDLEPSGHHQRAGRVDELPQRL